uniref:Uncharacterized protein n=1 Tax=Strigamia maritima TaxID=126957 RepID=T1J965_STRMM
MWAKREKLDRRGKTAIRDIARELLEDLKLGETKKNLIPGFDLITHKKFRLNQRAGLQLDCLQDGRQLGPPICKKLNMLRAALALET